MKTCTVNIFFAFLVCCNINQMYGGGVGLEEKTGEYIPLNLTFLNEKSTRVLLDSIINKPTVMHFVYFECKGLCDDMYKGIAEMVQKSKYQPGQDYQIVSLSILEKEKASHAREKKSYVDKLIQKHVPPDYWLFLTGDTMNISGLTESCGYYFMQNGDTIVHPEVLVFIDEYGKICRSMVGTRFLPDDFDMSLKGTKTGIVQNTVLRQMKYCYNYMAPARRYYGKSIMYTGAVVFILIIFFFILVNRKKNKPHF